MANFYGAARTNYFRVKNLKKFRKAVEGFNVTVAQRTDWVKGKEVPLGDAVCLLSKADSGWECYNEDIAANIEDLVANHLKDGEVAVFISCGTEKLRYLSGTALAINNKHETVLVDLCDIYEKAAHLGKNITMAEY